MDKAWAGVDAGKEFHWAHLLDASGSSKTLLAQGKWVRPRSRCAEAARRRSAARKLCEAPLGILAYRLRRFTERRGQIVR
jgi:hypothetical protein